MLTPRVLLIEDDLIFCNQCVKILLDNQYDVLFSNNAENAKLHVLNSKIDVAIIDLMLPPTYSSEGVDLYRYILTRNSKIKVLFMTSKDNGVTEIVANAMKMGAADFLDKHNGLFFDRLILVLSEMNFFQENIAIQPDNDDYQTLLALHQKMDIGFDDLKRGQAVLYRKLSGLESGAIERIRVLIQQDRVDRGEMIRTLDAIRRTLKFIQSTELFFDKELVLEAKKANDIIMSKIDLHHKLELTLPIIPLFLDYKVELSAGNDLKSLLAEIQEHWISLKNK